MEIVPHSNLEDLLKALSPRMSIRPTSPIPKQVVVPSVPFSDYLQLRIADYAGVCMGWEFITPQSFVNKVSGVSRDNPWDRNHLVWKILTMVNEFSQKIGVGAGATSRDRFALADAIADRFDQYSHYRPEIIRRWAAGGEFLNEAALAEAKESELWQRELWKKLERGIDALHPALDLQKIREQPEFRERLRNSFPEVLVLGTGSIDPLLVEVFGGMEEAGCKVSIQVILPCLAFLGDLRKRWERTPPAPDTDAESLTLEGDHPLLESMGRHAAGSFLLLGRLDDQYTHWPELTPAHEDSSASLLGRLQDDILNRRTPVARPVSEDDLSIRVHSCHGPRREMEVLRDEILRAFRDIPDLQPSEIHLVTPSLDIYAPLVSAILEQGGIPLKVRLSELPSSTDDPLVAGLLSLLELSKGGRFEASWLLELLQNRAVQKALEIEGEEQAVGHLCDWIRSSGLTQGLAGEASVGSWTFARDRLVAGGFFGPENKVLYPIKEFVLPVADELGSDSILHSRFVNWHARLEETLRQWQSECIPSQWAERLTSAVSDLLGTCDDLSSETQKQLAVLRAIDCKEMVDSGTLFDWLSTQTRESGRRTSPSGRIAFGRFKQLQNIPCRVLGMVGMKEGSFPGENRTPAWDLLQLSPRVWDRNARIDDRQLFLDGLLTPTDRLIITAPTQNVRSNRKEPLSSCVDELLRVLQQMGARRDQLVVNHRLQPFSKFYFNGNSSLPQSFDSYLAQIANEIDSSTKAEGIPLWSGNRELVPQGVEEISMRQLARFWKEPAKGFLQAQGILLAGEEVDDEELDRPPLSLDPLKSWKLRNSIVEEVSLGSGELELLKAEFRANRLLQPEELGSREWKKQENFGRTFVSAIKRHTGETLPFEIALNEPQVRLTGEIILSNDKKHLIASSLSRIKGDRHYLSPWISALSASCADHSLPTLLLDPEHLDNPLLLPAIPKAEALVILSRLVKGFLEGQHQLLCYAPETSKLIAGKLCGENQDAHQLVQNAASEWNRKEWNNIPGGEGSKDSSQLAWRDRDPFEHPDSWVQWAKEVSLSLQAWRALK